MNVDLLREHIKAYRDRLAADTETNLKDIEQRRERVAYYQSWGKDRLLSMTEEDLYGYLSRLWAMLIWGNKHYVVDNLVENHGLNSVRQALAEFVWGQEPLADRWNKFRKTIKGMGPAMMSEILCHTHPDDCMIWNRRAYVGLNYLGVPNLPRYSYQFTGSRYQALTDVAKQIKQEMTSDGVWDVTLLTVNYFIWDELQVQDNRNR